MGVFNSKQTPVDIEAVLEEATVLHEENKLQRQVIKSSNKKIAALKQQLLEAEAKAAAASKLYEELKAQMKAESEGDDGDEDDDD